MRRELDVQTLKATVQAFHASNEEDANRGGTHQSLSTACKVNEALMLLLIALVHLARSVWWHIYCTDTTLALFVSGAARKNRTTTIGFNFQNLHVPIDSVVRRSSLCGCFHARIV